MAYLSRLRTRRYTPPAAFRRWKTTLVRLSVYCPSVCRRARARARTHIYTHIHTHINTLHTYVRRAFTRFSLAVAAAASRGGANHRGASVSRGVESFRTYTGSMYTPIRAYIRLYASPSLIQSRERLARSLLRFVSLPTTTRRTTTTTTTPLRPRLPRSVPFQHGERERGGGRHHTTLHYTTTISPQVKRARFPECASPVCYGRESEHL